MTTPVIAGFFGDYRFLSNFYTGSGQQLREVFRGNQLSYPTVEHAFQASKSLDVTKRLQIALLVTPSEAKRFGRTLVLRPDWESVKDDVMLYWVREKFYRSPQLQERLIRTAPAHLLETNTWGDLYWGVDPAGNGKNRLGGILMQVRDELLTV